MPKEESKRLNISLPKTFYKEIKQKALEEDTTITELTIKALDQYQILKKDAPSMTREEFIEENEHRLTIRISNDLHDELRDLSFEARLSINSIINKAVKEYMARIKIK